MSSNFFNVAIKSALVVYVALTFGCAGPAFMNEPMQEPVDNGGFKAQLRMVCLAKGCLGLRLLVDSFTDAPINVDWQAAKYLRDDVEEAGGFHLLKDEWFFPPSGLNGSLGEIPPGYNYEIILVPTVNVMKQQGGRAAEHTLRHGNKDVRILHLGKHALSVPIVLGKERSELMLSTCLRRSEDPRCEGDTR